MVTTGTVCIRTTMWAGAPDVVPPAGRSPYPLRQARAAAPSQAKQAAAPEKYSATKNTRQKATHAGRQGATT